MDPRDQTNYVDWPKKVRVRVRQFADLLFSQRFRRRYVFFKSKVFSTVTSYAIIVCLAGYGFQYGVDLIPSMHNQRIQDAYKERERRHLEYIQENPRYVEALLDGYKVLVPPK